MTNFHPIEDKTTNEMNENWKNQKKKEKNMNIEKNEHVFNTKFKQTSSFSIVFSKFNIK